MTKASNPRLLEYQHPNLFLGKKVWKSASSSPMAANSAKMSDEARRLIALRRYYSGDSQTAFAARLGIEVKRWNNFERGLPISKEIAFKLVKEFPGLTTDWIWLGKCDGLPGTLRRELQESLGKVSKFDGPMRR